ncbi:substrate-binding periplasmic protein [Dongshaea marina]|uniref:substrate-binding periplasmic protein n=1 Tax=Dongshaea marina TaxID=2047966 RepID=UPI000D3E07FB|nr:transporter substrate-binding domain-containing protein [Dongshaea marina]
MIRAFLFLLLACFCQSVVSQTVTLSTGEWSPYNSEKLKYGGISNGLVEEAFAQEGIKVDYIYTSWPRAYRISEAGEVAGTCCWYESDKRRKTHFYSDPIVSDSVVWFHLKGRPIKWQSMKDLKGKRIVAIRGFTYNEAFYKAIEQGVIDVTFVNRLQQCFDMILAGRMDLTLEGVDRGYYVLRKNYPESENLFTNNPEPVVVTPIHFLISKKHPNAKKLMEVFNRGLSKLKAQGRVEEIQLLGRLGKLHLN